MKQFSRPNYSRYPDKNGGLVFSIYQPQVFVNSFKNEYNAVDLRLAKKAIADFRQKVADAGLGNLCVTVPDGRMGALMDDVLSNRLYAGGTIEDDDGTQYTLGTWTAEASAKYIGLDFIENIWI